MRKHTIWKKGIYAVCGLLAAGIISVQSGFISMAYPESGVINDSGVNIRSAADTGSTDNVMKKADQNMEVTVLDEQTGTDGKTWLKVSYMDNGTEKIGFVREDYVTLSEQTEPTEGTDGGQIPEGTEVPLEESNNPLGLVPVEGLNDELTCYLDIDQRHFYINQGFTDDMIPAGFTRDEVTYRNNTIQVAKSNDIEFYIVYLTDYDDQTTSDWYVYDAEAQGFCYWIKLETMQGRYLYLLDTFGGAQMNFGYKETVLELDGKQIQAWQLEMSVEEDLTGENDNFYYVFGINQNGNKGLYSYYATDGTYQRNILTGLEMVDDEYLTTEENTKLLESQLKELKTKYTEDMSRRFTIICILIVVCVLLLFIVIHVLLKSRKLSAEEDEEDEEEDEEDEEPMEERSGFLHRKASNADQEKPRGGKEEVERLIADELGEDETDQEYHESDIEIGMVMEFSEDEADGEDEEAAEAEAEEEEDEDEYVRPKRRGFFFGRRHEDDDEYDEDDEEDEDEEEDDDEEEYVEPKRRGFFFGRRHEDDDEYDEDDEEDEDEEEDDDEDILAQNASRKSRAADYAEKTVTAKRHSRIPEPILYDDEFEFEFIDLDDDDN